jgi:hypothetical protein
LENPMKSTVVLAGFAGLAASVASAATESLNVGTVSHRQREGSPYAANAAHPANEVRTWTPATGITVRQISLGGTLTTLAGSWGRETAIKVTPPGGATPFVIQPFATAAATPGVGTIVPSTFRTVLPTPVVANSGQWSFGFFEYWEDNDNTDTTTPNGEESIWANLVITLDDTAPTFLPPIPGAAASFVAPSGFASTTGAFGTTYPPSPGATQTWSPTIAANVDTIAIRGSGTGLTSLPGQAGSGITAIADQNPANVPVANLNTSIVVRQLVRVVIPGRTNVLLLAPFPGSAQSSSNADLPISLVANGGAATPAISGQPWTFEFAQNGVYGGATAANVPDTTITASQGFWNNFTASLANAAAPASTLITLTQGVTGGANGTFPAGANTVVQWYRFALPESVDQAANEALDIWMTSTSMAPEADGALALFGATGARIAADFNSGDGFMPLITIGAGNRNGQGNGFAFDGNDTGTNTSLAAGTYFLAAISGDTGTTIAPGLFQVTPGTENNAGQYRVNVRAWWNLPSTFEQPVPATNVTIRGTVTQNVQLNADTQRFAWFRFTLPGDFNDITGNFLDIDTIATTDTIEVLDTLGRDTVIALYNGSGARVATIDDVVGLASYLSFGATTVRQYDGLVPDGDGIDGELLAADGPFFLFVAPCCPTVNAQRYWTVPAEQAGTPVELAYPVNFRSNIPVPACPADVGGQGGAVGPDGALDNNDFAVFITLFFQQDPAADVGQQGGGVGPDNAWDNNDFAAFITLFFQGC